MIRPDPLEPGDRVAVISTAKQTSPEELAEGLSLLRSWGLEPVLGAHVYDTHDFYAGTDAHRAADLQQMLDDPSIEAILFSKGAYGTLRIIDQIDFSGFMKQPKWVAGYSDINVLHSRLHNLGVESIHSVMLQGMPLSQPQSMETLRMLLFGEPLQYELPLSARSGGPESSAGGILVGGNLSMLYALKGTNDDIDTRGKILFLEELDEYRYHLDRMLAGLKKAGRLEGLKGMLVGGMVEIKDSTLPFGKDAEAIIREYAESCGFPVWFGFPAGHMADNRALPLGRKVSIRSTAARTLISFG